jgi:hypothetical protein
MGVDVFNAVLPSDCDDLFYQANGLGKSVKAQ